MGEGCKTCHDLLSEGLNLCVRARQLDAIQRRQDTLEMSSDPEGWQRHGTFDRYVEKHNTHYPHRQIETRCVTPQIWADDQYNKDLLDWETRSREHLLKGCDLSPVVVPISHPKDES